MTQFNIKVDSDWVGGTIGGSLYNDLSCSLDEVNSSGSPWRLDITLAEVEVAWAAVGGNIKSIVEFSIFV